MDKEKIKTMFTGKRKIENLVVLLILSIIIVIAINYIWKDEKKNYYKKNKEVKLFKYQVKLKKAL